MFVNPFFGLKNTHQIISECGNQTQEKKRKKPIIICWLFPSQLASAEWPWIILNKQFQKALHYTFFDERKKIYGWLISVIFCKLFHESPKKDLSLLNGGNFQTGFFLSILWCSTSEDP